ncbi:MAG: hypothetical protein AAFX40_10535 [Cyanobacteria bacterium J06639_1]
MALLKVFGISEMAGCCRPRHIVCTIFPEVSALVNVVRIHIDSFSLNREFTVRYGKQVKTVRVSASFDLASEGDRSLHCFASQWGVRVAPA